MALTTAWDNELLATLPGTTPDLIDQQVISVLRDFCRRSGAWIIDEQKDITASQADYDFTSPTTTPPDGEVTMIHAVLVEGRWRNLADYTPALGTNITNFIYCPSPGTIRFKPVPTETITDGLVAAVAYMPPLAPTSSTIDDLFVSHWYEHILNGIKGRMMAMPGKPWSNIQLAAVHQRMYKSGISNARDTALKRYSKAETSWAFPRWA